MPLRIALLGPPQVEVDGRPLVVDTRKAIALLAYLAVVDRPIARDSLAELLWPDADPEGGRGALRRTLSTLRTGLGGAWLDIDRRQAALAREGVSVDVRDFRRGVASRDAASLAAAAAIFRGDFLEGFALRDSPAFDEWQLLEAEALRGELAGALSRLVGLESAAGRVSAAAAAARRLIALDPLDEAAHRSLIAIHAGGGDRAAAVRQYRECVRVLDRELGVGPAPETVALYESVVAGSFPVADVGAGSGAPGTPTPAGRVDASLAAVDPSLAAVDPSLAVVQRDVLEVAAVLGDAVDPDLARDVTGRPEADVAAALAALVQVGILREPQPGEPPDRYRFVDPARRGEIVAGLGIARRRALQRDAAMAHARSAAVARAAGAHAAAAEHYRSALALGHPDGLALHESLGDVETLRGRYGEALAAYEFGAAHAPTDAVAGFEHRLGGLHLRRGAFELADLHLAAALARLGSAPSSLRARVLADRSLVAARRGDTAAADRLARASRRAARAAGDEAGESQAENLLGMLARRANDADRARRHLRSALDRARAARNAGAEVAALNNLSLLERSAGDLGSALALADEALRRCVLAGDRHREAALRNNRADLLHLLGRGDEAADELTRAVALFVEVGERPGLEPEIWKLVEW